MLAMHLAPVAFAADTVQSQIISQKMRGALGPIARAGFTLVDPHTGDRLIAFADVASVKQFNGKSHLIGVAALGITAGVLLRCGPLGCGFHPAI